MWLEPQQHLDLAWFGHPLRIALDRRHQQALAVLGHDVLVVLLAPRRYLPRVHQLYALWRWQTVVWHPWCQGEGVQVCHGKDHEVAAKRMPRFRSEHLSASDIVA